MTVIVKEQLESRGLSVRNGQRVLRRVFKVHDDATPLGTPDAVVALIGTATTPDVIPVPGTLYANTVAGLELLYATEPTRIERISGQDIWEVELEHVDNIQVPPGSPPQEPTEVGFQGFTLATTPQPVLIWRENPGLSIPTDGDVVSLVADISGTPVDVSGEPITRSIFGVTIVVRKTVAAQPTASEIEPFLEARNSTVFFGFPIGTLALISIETERMAANLYSVVFTFVYDAWYHLRQIAAQDEQGVILDRVSSTEYHAEFVHWRQGFPKTKANFNSLGIDLGL